MARTARPDARQGIPRLWNRRRVHPHVGQSHAYEETLKIAKSLYFPDRTYQRILDVAGGVIDDEALKRFRRFIEAEKRDIKMEDAIEALKRIRDINEVTE